MFAITSNSTCQKSHSPSSSQTISPAWLSYFIVPPIIKELHLRHLCLFSLYCLLFHARSSAFFLHRFVHSFPLPSQLILCHFLLVLLQWAPSWSICLRLLSPFSLSFKLLPYEFFMNTGLIFVTCSKRMANWHLFNASVVCEVLFFVISFNYQDNLVKEILYSSEYLLNL